MYNLPKEDINFIRQEIKRKYKKILPYILERKHIYVNPYIARWDGILNRNETNLFMVFRCIGFPMYPQYPVGKCWADFGNPYYKVAIEADSKTYHTIEKDMARDKYFNSLGWKVYHIPSSLSFSNNYVDKYSIDSEDDNYEMLWKEYLSNTLFGVIECIESQVIQCRGRIPEDFQLFARKVSEKHLLIKSRKTNGYI